MALHKCPSCGREVSDKAPACIHCGCAVSQMRNTSIVCPECGKEVPEKDSACPNCGCPKSEMLNNQDNQRDLSTAKNVKECKPDGYKKEAFNFEDKECLEWLNDLSTADFGYTELGLYGNDTDNTSYGVRRNDGTAGALIFKHDKSDKICAIMIYFDDWENASALAVWIAQQIDGDFNSDDALMAIAMNQGYTNADMTVARINLSRDMEVAVLATEAYFASISS